MAKIHPETVVKGSCTFKFIADNIIGKDASFKGPFGVKKVTYCDYTASGKALQCIETFIHDYVYPLYANTHTTTNVTGLQTTRLREEARTVIKQCVNASDDDVVIFTGSGATGAIHKLIHVMNILNKATKTTVIVGPFEHHSNILPWKESGCKVERLRDGKDGKVDLNMLEDTLKKHKGDGQLLIVSTSVASNVTGILSDTEQITSLTHKYGGISLWDYATGAPYLKIDMNPSKTGYKDAVLISPHKFVGGVGTPGLLIAKKHLFNNSVPSQVGGGTVNWVTHQTHEYRAKLEEREEGGTPAIVESIRAGLVFQIKQAVGVDAIQERESWLSTHAIETWEKKPNIAILGSHQAKRLPIFSFLIKHAKSRKYLHHNFVSILLNDLYGIQVRGGCACAGPYAQDLLSMSEEMAMKFTKFLSQDENNTDDRTKLGIMKPGFARLNLPYFYDNDTIQYILDAVSQVAEHGWKLLPLYKFNDQSGDWFHRKHGLKDRTTSLMDIQYTGNNVTYPTSQCVVTGNGKTLNDMLSDAMQTIGRAKQLAEGIDCDTDPDLVSKLPSGMDASMIWFLQPKEVQYSITNLLKDIPIDVRTEPPFYNRRHTAIALSNPAKTESPRVHLEGRNGLTPVVISQSDTNLAVSDHSNGVNGLVCHSADDFQARGRGIVLQRRQLRRF